MMRKGQRRNLISDHIRLTLLAGRVFRVRVCSCDRNIWTLRVRKAVEGTRLEGHYITHHDGRIFAAFAPIVGGEDPPKRPAEMIGATPSDLEAVAELRRVVRTQAARLAQEMLG